MKKMSIFCLMLLSFLFSNSQMVYLKGVFSGTQEVPSDTSKGSGVVIVRYNTLTKVIELFGNYNGLTSTINNSHIHRGAPGVSGPVIVDLTNSGDTIGTLSGTGTLTKALEDSLLAGNTYANVHSTKFPAGELRAQLTVTTAGQTDFLSGKLTGAQEAPPNISLATGSAYALVDRGTNIIYLTGSYSGFSGPSNAAHVHLQDPGVPGSVLFPITHSSAVSGTIHAVDTVRASAADSISNGHSYVNVHTSKFTGGEIRGQLLNTTGVHYFAGTMSGANEVPPNTSAAGGTVIVTYNTETNILQLVGDYQNLSAAVTGSHIHTGAAGTIGPVIIDLINTGGTTGVLTGTDTLTDAQEMELFAGNLYANVHSTMYTNGEIRTQLHPTTDGQTQAFTPLLTGPQEVPPNSSKGTGQAVVLLDRATGIVYVTGRFGNLTAAATGGHIHAGRADTTGPIVIGLNVAGTTSGTISGSDTISMSFVDSMINGFTYINIHTSAFTGGEIRSQLGALLLPLKLTYLNAYKQRNNIELIWETSEEQNVSRYEIEQLNTNTKNWITKGTVYANGGNSSAKYSFTDIPNIYGNKYLIYRLKMMDKDGKISYSYMVKVNFEKLKAELFIQTNPVSNGELRYTITGLSTGKKAEVSIIDYNGRLLLKNTISSLMNNTLKIPHLSAGMYKLVVRVDDTILQQSFIK